jgi:cytochrome P450
MFRFSATAPPVRKVLEDFVYDEILLPKDTRLFLCNPLAGRDPSAFPDVDEFQPERNHENRHVGFGRGAHMCPGQHLARVQIVEALHLMAQRIRNPRLVGEVKWRAFLGVWGPSTLPIAFDPAPARVS